MTKFARDKYEIEELRSEMRRLADQTYSLRGELSNYKAAHDNLAMTIQPLLNMLTYNNQLPAALEASMRNLLNNDINGTVERHLKSHVDKLHRAVVFSQVAENS